MVCHLTVGSSAPRPAPRPAAPKISTLAFTSLVLGALSLFLYVLTALPAVICGHFAWSKIRRSAGEIEGREIALVGLLVGYVSLGLSGVVIGKLVHGIWSERQARQEARLEAGYTRSQWNLRQLVWAQLIHARQHNGRLADDMEELREILDPYYAYYQDLPHTDELEDDGYALVSGLHASMPPDTIVVREAKPRRDRAIAVGFINGAVAVVSQTSTRTPQSKPN